MTELHTQLEDPRKFQTQDCNSGKSLGNGSYQKVVKGFECVEMMGLSIQNSTPGLNSSSRPFASYF